MRVASGATSLFDRLGGTSCWCINSGTRLRRAANPTGTATYPPLVKTTCGRTFLTMLIACIIPIGIRITPVIVCHETYLRSLPALTVAKRKPAAGTISVSNPSSLPRNTISAWYSSRNCVAIARAGYICPPVPPPDTSTRIPFSISITCSNPFLQRRFAPISRSGGMIGLFEIHSSNVASRLSSDQEA